MPLPSLTKELKNHATYDGDMYSWATDQANMIRNGRLSEIDVENVSEEIEDLARSIYRNLVSAFEVLLMHMLKWDYQPDRQSRSWANTIAAQRADIVDLLEESPSLKSEAKLLPALQKGYRKGRLNASGETDMPVSSFPEECPYSFEEIMSKEFIFDREATHKYGQ